MLHALPELATRQMFNLYSKHTFAKYTRLRLQTVFDDDDRGVKGQNIKQLAQVFDYKTLSNFCVLFTQARFAIQSKMK